MSKINLALLGLLAYRTFQGKGRLADMLGTNRAPAPQPGDVHPPGANPYGGNAGATEAGGGLGDLLRGGLGGLGGLLGGGAAGGLLAGGLGDLLKQFQQHGQGEAAQSWVGTGPNQSVPPQNIEAALGPDKIAWLMRETGMTRAELLAGLSERLPEVVDKLTPEGRLPTEQDAQKWV
jgi:uncharacterized protein YidB (DUF937 family)